jgi:hypothetical protein
MIVNEALMEHLIIFLMYHIIWATLVIGKYDLIIIGLRLMEWMSGKVFFLVVTTCMNFHGRTLILNCFVHVGFVNKILSILSL